MTTSATSKRCGRQRVGSCPCLDDVLLNFDSGAVDEGTVLTCGDQEMALASVDSSGQLSLLRRLSRSCHRHLRGPGSVSGRPEVVRRSTSRCMWVSSKRRWSFPAGGGDMTTAIEGGRLNAISTSAAPGKVDIVDVGARRQAATVRRCTGRRGDQSRAARSAAALHR